MLLSVSLYRRLSLPLPRRDAEAERDEYAEPLRRFPAVTPAAIRQGASPDDGRRGLTLLGAALCAPGHTGADERDRCGDAQLSLLGDDTERERSAAGRLSPDWLELLLGLPIGWTSAGCTCGEYEEWAAGWCRLDSWRYGPGWWLGYAPGTTDLPRHHGIWEQTVSRVTHIRHVGDRARVLCTAVSPFVMACAVGFLTEGQADRSQSYSVVQEL